jgi:hypothetical protein
MHAVDSSMHVRCTCAGLGRTVFDARRRQTICETIEAAVEPLREQHRRVPIALSSASTGLARQAAPIRPRRRPIRAAPARRRRWWRFGR